MVRVTQSGAFEWEDGDNRVVSIDALSADRLVVAADFGGRLSVNPASDEDLRVRPPALPWLQRRNMITKHQFALHCDQMKCNLVFCDRTPSL